MSGFIKNQLLKHLSKFAKDLTPDKIQLSALRGEGHLNNLILDEQVLMGVLDLPTWLTLTKAVCNRVVIKVQWTKLKSQPIVLYLDEVIVEVSCSSKGREPSSRLDPPLILSGGRYGLIDKVIDGMSVIISSVVINFSSSSFEASAQLSRIEIRSMTPTWTVADLKQCRLKELQAGEVILFKEAVWQTSRIEARATLEDSSAIASPLRLISNQSRMRFTWKRRLNDCSVVSSKLEFLFDDLLSVLTDSQLKEALLFGNELRDLIDREADVKKMKAQAKLKRNQRTPGESAPSGWRPGRSPSNAAFQQHNLQESSLHLSIQQVDLHLCADADSGGNVVVEGGAMQLLIKDFAVDHYPYHPSGEDKSHWERAGELSAETPWPESPTAHEGVRRMESWLVLRVQSLSLFGVSQPEVRRSRHEVLSSRRTERACLLEYVEFYFPQGCDAPVPLPSVQIHVDPWTVRFDPLSVRWCVAIAQSLSEHARQGGDAIHVSVRLAKPKVMLSEGASTLRLSALSVSLSNAASADCPFPSPPLTAWQLRGEHVRLEVDETVIDPIPVRAWLQLSEAGGRVVVEPLATPRIRLHRGQFVALLALVQRVQDFVGHIGQDQHALGLAESSSSLETRLSSASVDVCLLAGPRIRHAESGSMASDSSADGGLSAALHTTLLALRLDNVSLLWQGGTLDLTVDAVHTEPDSTAPPTLRLRQSGSQQEITLQGGQLSLRTAALEALSAWSDGPPLLLVASVTDILLRITGDAAPIHVQLPSLLVTRDQQGVLALAANDADSLLLRTRLDEAERRLRHLEDEREQHVDTIRKLQEQLRKQTFH